MMMNVCWLNVLWLDKIVFKNSYWVKFVLSLICGIMVDNGVKDLVGSRLNVIGVMVVLNIGSFNIFIVKVKSYVFGRSFFIYKDIFGSIKFKLVSN